MTRRAADGKDIHRERIEEIKGSSSLHLNHHNQQLNLHRAGLALFVMVNNNNNNNRMKVFLALTLAASACVSSTAAAADDPSSAAAATSDFETSTCGLYMAPSSTQEADGPIIWGLYSGKEIGIGEPIGPAEVAINIHHLKANSIVKHDSKAAEIAEDLQFMVDMVESYLWVPPPVGGRFEQEEGRLVSAVPGAGVLAGFDIKLTNAAWNHAAPYHRQAWNTRPGVGHAGRGAQSPFFDATLEATAEIAAGSEIFMDYGENWAEEEKREALLLEDFKNLDTTIAKMIAFFEKHDDLPPASKIQIYNFLTKDVLTAAIGPFKAKTAAALLPTDPAKLKEIPEKGGILVHSAPTVYRQRNWLEEEGFCVDYMKPGPSTIEEAGRGAMAARDIKAGTILTASPLVHIPDKAILDLHPITPAPDDPDEYIRAEDKVIGQQLLLNYCYGHPQSSMVFFPAGPMASMINHGGPEKANVKLQWSKHPKVESEWFEKAPQDFLSEDMLHLGLVMEVVATRDISEGEEIFLDYGKDWQKAWDAHKKKWKGKDWPLQAIDFNAKYKEVPFETVADLGKDPTYPEHVQLKAFLMIEESLRAGTRDDPKLWAMPEEGTAYEAENLFDLVIEDKTEADMTEDGKRVYEYLIRWTNNRGIETYVDHVPHEAIVFVDAPGHSEQFTVKEPFRHVIGIPDDVFPNGPWRNLA